jgi:peroxiredoxin
VLLRAPLLEGGQKERVYFLYQSDKTPADPTENVVLAKIVVGGKPKPMRLPDPRALSRCQPFAPIRDEELATTDTSELAAKGLVFVATDTDPKKFQINKKTYTQYKTPVQIRLNTAEQWTVMAGSQDHPFHIHVNPFQVVMRKTADGKWHPMNEWRDTLYVRESEMYIIRSRFQDFLGKTVIHCHFLDHEDQGMMMPIEFIPPYQKPQPAQFVQAAVLKPAAVLAPALKLADPNGKWHELAALRPRNVLLIFFQGMECGHCTDQLARFLRAARTKLGPTTEIVAVSSRRVADPGKAAATLGAQTADRFTLLEDEDGRAFRQFGCYEDGPLHGLFLIDRTGMIRARYTGAAPFEDVQAVADRVAALTSAAQKTVP